MGIDWNNIPLKAFPDQRIRSARRRPVNGKRPIVCWYCYYSISFDINFISTYQNNNDSWYTRVNIIKVIWHHLPGVLGSNTTRVVGGTGWYVHVSDGPSLHPQRGAALPCKIKKNYSHAATSLAVHFLSSAFITSYSRSGLQRICLIIFIVPEPSVDPQLGEEIGTLATFIKPLTFINLWGGYSAATALPDRSAADYKRFTSELCPVSSAICAPLSLALENSYRKNTINTSPSITALTVDSQSRTWRWWPEMNIARDILWRKVQLIFSRMFSIKQVTNCRLSICPSPCLCHRIRRSAGIHEYISTSLKYTRQQKTYVWDVTISRE